MSDSGLDILTSGDDSGGTGGPSRGGRRRADTPKRKPFGRWLLVLVVLVAIVAGGFWAWGKVSDRFAGAEDYTGAGTGQVTVEIPSGAGGQQIANILVKQDVVKSAEAFYQLVLKDERINQVQAGFYTLRKQMSAEYALRGLVDKGNRVEGKVVVPEGSRVGQIVKAIAAGSEIKAADVTKQLDDPSKLGLPAEANGNPEGYLFPATYTVEPGTTALELLQQMVQKTLSVEKSLDIETRAQALGLDKEQVLTVASILEYEANRKVDYPKVARVLYNRLEQNIPLQLDSTVSYVSQREGDVWTTPDERANPSLYNTYQHQGLPPGPIGSPGEVTIEAALNPDQGDWLYFVPDFEKGTTIFTNNLADHEKAAEKAREYCRTHEEC